MGVTVGTGVVGFGVGNEVGVFVGEEVGLIVGK